MKNKLKTIIAMLALALAWLAPEALAYHQHNDYCITNQWTPTWSKHTVDNDFGYLTVSDYSWTQTEGAGGVKQRWDREYNVDGELVKEFWFNGDEAFWDILVVIERYSCWWLNYWGYAESESALGKMTIKHSGNPACTNLSVSVTGMAWRRGLDNAWLYDTNISTAYHHLEGPVALTWQPAPQITSFQAPLAVRWTWAW